MTPTYLIRKLGYVTMGALSLQRRSTVLNNILMSLLV